MPSVLTPFPWPWPCSPEPGGHLRVSAGHPAGTVPVPTDSQGDKGDSSPSNSRPWTPSALAGECAIVRILSLLR